jgi:hypothetical protein
MENNKVARKEADTLFFYCKTHHFISFAEKYNDTIPVEGKIK